jgi:hypothetical protein
MWHHVSSIPTSFTGELATLKRQLRDHERLVQFRAQGASKIKLLQTEVLELASAVYFIL